MRGLESRESCFTRPTTPTTVCQGSFDGSSTMRMRLHWVLPGPELVGHVLVDDDSNWLGHIVMLVEESATPQRDPHGFKIMATNNPFIRIKKFLAGKWDSSFHRDRRPCKGFAQRK